MPDGDNGSNYAGTYCRYMRSHVRRPTNVNTVLMNRYILRILPRRVLIVRPRTGETRSTLANLYKERGSPRRQRRTVSSRRDRGSIRRPIRRALLTNRLQDQLALLRTLMALTYLRHRLNVSTLRQLNAEFYSYFARRLFSRLLPVVLAATAGTVAVVPAAERATTT